MFFSLHNEIHSHYFYLCVSLRLGMSECHVCTCPQSSEVGATGLLGAVVSAARWVLGTQLRSSGEGASVLNR